MHLSIAWLLAATSLLVSSQSLAQAHAVTSSGLRLLDSVRIAESDTFVLSKPTRLIVGPKGHYFVADAREAHIVELSPSGTVLRRIGRRGSGPGELNVPGSLAISGDTLLSVMDLGQRRVSHWDLRTGEARGSFVLPGWMPALRYHGGVLRVGVLDLSSGSAVASMASAGAAPQREGVVPRLFQRQPTLASAFGAVAFADDGDDVYAVFEIADTLFRWRRGARQAVQLPLPRARRKGVRPELFEALLREPAKAQQLAFDRSIPHLLQRVRAQTLALVTLEGTMTPRGLVGQFAVSLLDLANRRACVDLAIPAAPDPLPSLAFAGDTLVVLQQGEDAHGDATAWVHRYIIDARGCAWLPLANSRPVSP